MTIYSYHPPPPPSPLPPPKKKQNKTPENIAVTPKLGISCRYIICDKESIRGMNMKQPYCLVLKLRGNSVCIVGDIE